MGLLINNFNKLYPSFAATKVNGVCVINEQETEDTAHNFRQLTIGGFNGWQFPHELPKKATSFYNMSQEMVFPEQECHGVVRLDCDSILCVEEDDKIVFYVCELKSSYIQSNIVKAKDQIVGSYIKLCGMLSLLQGYDKDKIEICGIIVAYESDAERISGMKCIDDPRTRFCISLYDKLIYNMPRRRCEAFWHPLALQDIKFKYVKVPYAHKNYTIDFSLIKQ